MQVAEDLLASDAAALAAAHSGLRDLRYAEANQLLTVRARPRCSCALSVSHSKSYLRGAFVWARGALNG